MNVAIVGSRDYPNKQAVFDYVRGLPKDTIIISGGARGVDQWAYRAAHRYGLKIQEFQADWEKYGKRAGMIRNADIVKASDRIVAFWDGKSKGTKNTIDRAKKVGKPVEIIK